MGDSYGSPSMNGEKQGEDDLLASCYRHCLAACFAAPVASASEKELQLIAFPAISTSVYHYPMLDAAKIALIKVKNF